VEKKRLNSLVYLRNLIFTLGNHFINPAHIEQQDSAQQPFAALQRRLSIRLQRSVLEDLQERLPPCHHA
jgi:hypothetical protein